MTHCHWLVRLFLWSDQKIFNSLGTNGVGLTTSDCTWVGEWNQVSLRGKPKNSEGTLTGVPPMGISLLLLYCYSLVFVLHLGRNKWSWLPHRLSQQWENFLSFPTVYDMPMCPWPPVINMIKSLMLSWGLCFFPRKRREIPLWRHRDSRGQSGKPIIMTS